jgi:hypothetical protein
MHSPRPAAWVPGHGDDPRVSITQYRPFAGAHLCSLWTDPATDCRAARTFLLNAGSEERALCVLEASREGGEATRAAADGLSRAGASVFATDDVHVAGGIFDPGRMRRFWVEQAAWCREGGGSHLRAVAEMGWVLRGCPGTEQVCAFESSLNPLLQPLPASVICQYGSARFGADVLLGMVLSHPRVVIEHTVFVNPFAVSHERFGPHYDSLRVDAAAALLPVWAYFLSEQPSRVSLGRFLCNSLPTLLPADRVVVGLPGLAHPLELLPRYDRVAGMEGSAGAEPGSLKDRVRMCAEGPWGRVGHACRDGWSFLAGWFAEERGAIVAARAAKYSERDILRFVTLVWHAADGLRAVGETPAEPPRSEGAGWEAGRA